MTVYFVEKMQCNIYRRRNKASNDLPYKANM